MNIAIILTGGNGSRMGLNKPKQFLLLKEKELFLYPLITFLNHPLMDKIVLVINKDFEDDYKQILKKNNINNIILVNGGACRQESVYNALKYLKSQNIEDDSKILIHDGARALVSKEIISENISTLKEFSTCSITVDKIYDTIVDLNYSVIDRDNLLSVQTPQTFYFKDIFSMHSTLSEKKITSLTDDGQIAKKFNFKINYVKGNKQNFKLTCFEDIKIANAFLER